MPSGLIMQLLSLIICTYNREKFLGNSLCSVAAQPFPVGRYELILVDNASTDSTPEIAETFAREFPNVQFRYVRELNQGLSHARNRGISEARGEVLVFLDDDVQLDEEYLHVLWEFYEKNPEVMATGHAIEPKYLNREPVWMSKYLAPMVGRHVWSAEPVPYRGRKFPVGASMAFRREVFEQIGGFNPDLGRKGKALGGNEEKDLFYRMREKNMPVWFLPGVKLFHLIDDQRLTFDYVRRQATGVGLSERLRLRDVGFGGWLAKIWEECIKGGGTVVLSLLFLLRGHGEKALMLCRFRVWVWKGLFGIGRA